MAMAAGQLSDVDGFIRILGTYQVLPGDLPTFAAWVLLITEAVAGAALLRGAQGAATLALAVALAWSALAVQAFVRGLPVANCGCFGVHLGQELRWWVLLEDAEFIALAAWVRRAGRRDARSPEPSSKTSRGDA